jgi:uncharacterized membrane protein YfcA
LIFVSVLLLLKPYLSLTIAPVTGFTKIVVLLITGIFTGFLSGMMGIGGGTIMVPAMVLLAGIGQHMAQGVSLLAMVPAGGVGAFTHWRLGNVTANLLVGLIPGIITGTYMGGVLAHLLPDSTLRVIFAAVLVWTGFHYVKTSAPE